MNPGQSDAKSARLASSPSQLRLGPTLVVPVQELEHSLDVPPNLLQHLTLVAQKIGQAVQRTVRPETVRLLIAGLEARQLREAGHRDVAVK